MAKLVFNQIYGLKTILALGVLSIHVINQLHYFTFMQKNEELRLEEIQNLNKAWWVPLVTCLAYQVDIFFMLSTLILTFKFCSNLSTEEEINKNRRSIFSFIQTLLYEILNRYFTLIAGTIFSIGYTLLVGDYGTGSSYLDLLELLVFTTRRDRPINSNVMWSNGVDLIGYFIILFILTFTQKFVFSNDKSFAKFLLNNTNKIGIFLLFIFWIPRICVYFFSENPGSYSLLKQYNHAHDFFIPPWMILDRQINYSDRFHTESWLSNNYIDVGNGLVKLFDSEYKIWHQRLAPFAAGCWLGLWLWKELQNKESTISNTKKRLHKILFYLANSMFLLILLIALSKTKSKPLNVDPYRLQSLTLQSRFTFDLIFSVFLRGIFSLSIGYLVTRMSLPESNPLHISFPLFSNSYFVTFGKKYCYLFYLLHMRSMITVMYTVHHQILQNLFGPNNFFLRYSVWMILTFLHAMILTFVIEKFHAIFLPIMQNIVKFIFNKNKIKVV